MSIWKQLSVLLDRSIIRRAWDAQLWAINKFRPGPRYLSIGERRRLSVMHGDSIRRELSSRSSSSREHEERQRLRYVNLWTSGMPVERGATLPPDSFDSNVPEHVRFALTVVGEYDEARESSAAFVDCLYRPVSDLPYPQVEIRRCCEFLIAIADGDSASFGADHELLVRERDALGIALFSLDHFLDLPASEIPRQKMQNLAFVKHRYVDRANPHATPKPGDVVLIGGPGSGQSIAQVIGVCDTSDWMVITESGLSVQVAAGTESGTWNQVKVIAPASAGWLSLTPPAGMSAWEA